MPWGQIARFVVALIAPYLIDLGIRLTGIYNSIQGLAKEREPYNIEALVRNIYDDERNVDTGLPAILAQVKFISDDHENSLQTILNAITALPAGSAIPTAADNATGVWDAIDPFSDSETIPYGQELANAHRWATFMIRQGSVPGRFSPFFNVAYPPFAPDTIPTNNVWPQPDWADIRPTDDLLEWLTRTCPLFTWSADGDSENIRGYLTELYEPEATHFSPKMTNSEWQNVFGQKRGLAPIWPGKDWVNLGEPTVLTETAIVAGPMDGILLTVDSGPGGAGQWGVGDFRSYYRAGYVVFLDADGHADTTQFVGPDDNIFAPKGMSTAASVVVGLNKATQITVTPWTLL